MFPKFTPERCHCSLSVLISSSSYVSLTLPPLLFYILLAKYFKILDYAFLTSCLLKTSIFFAARHLVHECWSSLPLQPLATSCPSSLVLYNLDSLKTSAPISRIWYIWKRCVHVPVQCLVKHHSHLCCFIIQHCLHLLVICFLVCTFHPLSLHKYKFHFPYPRSSPIPNQSQLAL